MNGKITQSNPTEGFWSNMSLVYGSLENIRETSNRIVDHAFKLRAFSTKEKDEIVYSSNKASGDELDLTPAKKILSDIKKEVNSILSYASVLYQHLEKKPTSPNIPYLAQMLLLELEYPDHLLYPKIYEISLACDIFAQASNNIKLNPTKKSIKAAFGIDVKIESAKLKAYLESSKSNY